MHDAQRRQVRWLARASAPTTGGGKDVGRGKLISLAVLPGSSRTLTRIHARGLGMWASGNRQLLTFIHIRQGESPEDAALREAHEETSLSQLSVARKLGETTYDLSPYRYEIQHRHVFQLQVHEPTQQRWPSQELHDGQQPPTRLECFWIPLRNAHVLQAGQGALIGAIAEE